MTHSITSFSYPFCSSVRNPLQFQNYQDFTISHSTFYNQDKYYLKSKTDTNIICTIHIIFMSVVDSFSYLCCWDFSHYM